MDLTPETLQHVARLARLDLDEEERARLHRDIVHVLELFDALGDRATGEAGLPAVALRPDVVARDGSAADVAALLANVPRLKDGRIDVGRSG